MIVNDDVAVEDSTYTTGRRGIAGTVFVHKVAGAAAEKGAPLAADQIAETLVTKVVDDLKMEENGRVAVLINGLGATPANLIKKMNAFKSQVEFHNGTKKVNAKTY